MPRSRKLIKFQFLPYRYARTSNPATGTAWIDVSSRGGPPYDQLSPFYAHGDIPIPGMAGRKADSVEGIWQGLKVIRGRIAPRFFEGGGRKRNGKPSGHHFGDADRLLGLEEARRKIYGVAYEWMLEHKVEKKLIATLIARAFHGVPQFLYDREDNRSISRDEPLAHASLLTHYLNAKIDEQLKR